MESKLSEIVKGNLSKEAYTEQIKETINTIHNVINSVNAAAMEKSSKNTSDTELKETEKTYRLGDKFIFKTFREHKLTKTQAKKLLEGKEIKIKLKSKAGKDYEISVFFVENGKLDSKF